VTGAESLEQRARGWVAEMARQAGARKNGFSYSDSASQLPAGRRILDSDPALRAAALRVAIEAYVAVDWGKAEARYDGPWALASLIREIVRRHPGLGDDDLGFVARAWRGFEPALMAPGGFVGCVERSAAAVALSPATRQAVLEVRDVFKAKSRTLATRKLCERLDAALGAVKAVSFDARDAWARPILAEIEKMPKEVKGAWSELLAHGASEDAPRPGKAWLAKAQPILDRIGVAEFRRRSTAWFALVQAPPSGPDDNAARMSDVNAACLRALVWTSTLAGDGGLPRALGDLALASFQKLYEVGPYSARLGNACVYALGAMASKEAVGQLARLQAKVKYVGARALIDKAYQDAAGRQGVTVEEVQQASVPTYGLDGSGVRREPIGSWRAEIRVEGPRRVELLWFAADGRPLKAMPAAVRHSEPGRLRELRRAVEEIRNQLPAQRARLEAMLLGDRSLPMTDWRTHYIEHPLVGVIARRLIWESGEGKQRAAFVFDAGRLVAAEGQSVRAFPKNAQLRLWHPQGASPDAVLAWRRLLVARGITQPFAQAHRQVYLLTAAERRSRTYSSRFAGHLLREHVLAALCRERGWRYKLQIGDPGSSPTMHLPRFDLTAELEVSSTGTLYTDIHETLSTGRVVFKDAKGKPRPLADVPERVFSEVMRDVDLLVTVPNIALDPTWPERAGPSGLDDWKRRAFGALDLTADGRRSLLADLLPDLSIADRCRIEGRYLCVQGQRRRYKIHLGSANVLMEPNDQYLCVVPATEPRAATVMLPFDGDSTLTVILSKAFLLADDSRIEDPDVLRQMKAERDNL
jgi:hypothetical protein